MKHQETIETIQQQHEYLLRQSSEISDVDLDVSEVETFLKTLAGAGKYTENTEQRSLLRALIRYWASITNNYTGKFPVFQLQPFDSPPVESGADKYASGGSNAIVSSASDLDEEEDEPHQIGTFGAKLVPSVRAKAVWNWLSLLVIVVVVILAAAAFGLLQNYNNFQSNQSQRQYQNNLSLAATQFANSQQLAQESALQTYLNRMSDILTNPNVHNLNQSGMDLRTLARASTVTILSELNTSRKEIVLRFLYAGGLISRQGSNPNIVNPIVNLNGADFSGITLVNFDLSGADLALTNFSGAALNGANLNSAYLAGANLSKTNLSGANLRFAQLFNQQPKPPETVNLTGADLKQADLTNADLEQANLTNADLTGAILTNANLNGITWQNTFCPNGSNSSANNPATCIGR